MNLANLDSRIHQFLSLGQARANSECLKRDQSRGLERLECCDSGMQQLWVLMTLVLCKNLRYRFHKKTQSRLMGHGRDKVFVQLHQIGQSTVLSSRIEK